MCARSLCFGVWWAVTIEGAVTIKRSRTNISRVGHAFLDAYVDAYMGMEGTVNRNSLVARILATATTREAELDSSAWTSQVVMARLKNVANQRRAAIKKAEAQAEDEDEPGEAEEAEEVQDVD